MYDKHVMTVVCRMVYQSAIYALCFARIAPAYAQEAVRADAVLRIEQGPSSETDLNNAIEELRADLAAGRVMPYARLITVVSDQSQHQRVRFEVLQFLLEQPDPAVLSGVVAAAAHWQPILATDDWKLDLRYVILSKLPDHPALPAVATMPEFVEILRNAAINADVLTGSDHYISRLLICAPLDETIRSDIVVQAVLAHPRGNFLGEEFVFAITDPIAIQTLRDALRASPQKADGFHFGAASTLAMLGDAEAAAELRRRADELDGLWGKAGYGQFPKIVERYADFAKAVSTNTMVEYLTETPADRVELPAALLVAKRKGLTLEQVRPALTKMAEQAEAHAKTLTSKPRTQRNLALLRIEGIRRVGIEYGFLYPTDFAEAATWARERQDVMTP